MITLLLWKMTNFGRFLQPKIRKKEVRLEDLIVSADDNAKFEGDADLEFNPVVQARMLIEGVEKGHRKGKGGLGANAAGALKKLFRGMSFGEPSSASARKKEKMRALDRNLAKDAKEQEALAKQREADEKVFKQAEAAALEAARRR